jgi:Domain of unknown function (DUF6378)
MNREEILQQAIDLTMGDRNEQNGDPFENHQRIAKIWSVILNQEIAPYQVALCMAGLKLARLAFNPLDDSFIDGAAYLAIAGEIVNKGEADEKSSCSCSK